MMLVNKMNLYNKNKISKYMNIEHLLKVQRWFTSLMHFKHTYSMKISELSMLHQLIYPIDILPKMIETRYEEEL